MPSFDSAGSGFSRGFARGGALALQKKEMDQRKAEQEEKEKQAKIDSAKKAFDDSATKSEEVFNQFGEVLVQMAPNVKDDDPRFQQVLSGAVGALASHASLIKAMRDQAANLGAPPEFLEAFPDPQEFIAQRVPLLQAKVNAARLEKEVEPLKTNTFFAEVKGVGTNVRVEERKTPQGSKFFVDGQEVPASSVGQPVNRTQEVGNLQIPGLSTDQSGREIMAMRQQVAAANSYTALAQRMAEDIVNRPEKLGTVGDVVRAFGSFTSQVEGLANVLGLDSPFVMDDGTTPAGIDDFTWPESLAGETAAVKRTVLDLVFMDLNSKGQTGRAISDKDLQFFLDYTGINSGDPRQVIAGLQRGSQNNATMLKEQVGVRSGGAFGVEDIAPGGITEFKAPAEKSSAGDANKMALEILNKPNPTSEDLDKAEALLDAALKGDEEALKKLLGGE